jgi:Flp pilus assembly protein TadG
MTATMIETLIGFWRRLRHAGNSGAATVELAITAPLLITLLLGVADYGILMNRADALIGATRAGAEVVKANQNTTGPQLTALGIFPANATPTVSQPPFCTCVDNTAVGCPGAGAANPCAAKADTRVLKYVTVSATQPFAPLFAWPAFAFPASPLNASTVVRLQ